jgi:pimeloyl-ACP methyl ester carboxylesterase
MIGASACISCSLILLLLASPPLAAQRDTTSHRVQFVTVENDVRLETIDWGGSGRPIVFLAGLGDNAHVFDRFAPKLTDRYHVYGITRRGFPPSSVAKSGYLADSLADDALAVIDSLHLDHPVLIGHSIAGSELSSIGERHPDRVSGLVYLDAGWEYAFYDPSLEGAGPFTIPDVVRRLSLIFDAFAPLTYAQRAAMIRQMADTTLPLLIRDLRPWGDDLAEAPDANVLPKAPPRDPVQDAVIFGEQRHTKVRAPVLAFFVAPAPPRHGPPPTINGKTLSDSARRVLDDSLSLSVRIPKINAFQRGIPQAKVVILPHANHYIFRSNEEQVLGEIRVFIDSLPPRNR